MGKHIKQTTGKEEDQPVNDRQLKQAACPRRMAGLRGRLTGGPLPRRTVKLEQAYVSETVSPFRGAFRQPAPVHYRTGFTAWRQTFTRPTSYRFVKEHATSKLHPHSEKSSVIQKERRRFLCRLKQAVSAPKNL